jgi:hypothetical protein
LRTLPHFTEFAPTTHKTESDLAAIRQSFCSVKQSIKGMTWTVIAGIHDDKLVRKSMQFAKLFPSDWIGPDVSIMRPWRHNHNFFWLDFFGLKAIFHEPIERHNDAGSLQAVRQHAGQYSRSQ